MMDSRPIGVFDSGLGGLTVVRELLRLLPQEDIVYFGDNGRMPYGTRGENTVRRYTREDCRFLRRFDCKVIIAACGTASSVAADELTALDVPAIEVTEPAAAAAAAASKTGRFGIAATSATVQNGAFTRAILSRNPRAQVFCAACPILVSLVEAGWISPDDEITVAAAKRYLRDMMGKIDTLIMGCTHFPLLAPVFRKILGNGVCLIDPGKEAAAAAKDLLNREHLTAPKDKLGRCLFYVSDRPGDFSEIAERFLGRPAEDVRTVDPAMLAVSGA